MTIPARHRNSAPCRRLPLVWLLLCSLLLLLPAAAWAGDGAGNAALPAAGAGPSVHAGDPAALLAARATPMRRC